MNNNQPLVSVIVPIYNVQDYLEKCFDSIKTSSYKNIEIILVDDGATDSCPEICDRLKETDDRVKVVHKKNGGLSSARNAGFEAASGEYICFIDSDDYIKHDMIEKLLKKALEYNADVVQCGYCKVGENGEKYGAVASENVLLDTNKKVLDAFFKDGSYNVVVWNKIYRRELIEGISFVEGKNNEDNMFDADIFVRIQRAYLMKDIGYMYLQRGSSIMGGAFTPKKMDAFYALKYMMKRGREHYPEYIKYIKKLVCLDAFYIDYLICANKSEKEYSEYRTTIGNEFRKNWKDIRNAGILGRADKIRLGVYSRSPRLSFFLYSLFLKINKLKHKLCS